MLRCTNYAEVSRYTVPGHPGYPASLAIRQAAMTLSSSTPHLPDDSISIKHGAILTLHVDLQIYVIQARFP